MRKFNELLSVSRTPMMVIFLLIIILTGTSMSNQLYAQQAAIRGELYDTLSKKPIPNANLSLQKNQANAGKPILVSSGKEGRFQFSSVTDGSYTLTITCVGYKPMSFTLQIKSTDIDFGRIYLMLPDQTMTGVTIISKGPAVSQKDDTAQYNASQYQVNPDATTEDLVKKMPGISVDRNGVITAQGEQVRKVTVDGKDFFGDDATAALRNIPANVVDKIQVFDRMSDQAQMTGIDDGNTQKSINIITKAGIQNAQFGRLYAGAGTDDRYAAGGNMSFFKKDRRLSFAGNFNNINQQNFGSQDLLGISGPQQNNPMRMPGGGGGGMGGFRPGGGNFGGPAESFTVNNSAGINTTNAIGVNYSDKWGKSTTITGSYFFNQTKNDNISDVNNKLFEQELISFQNNDLFSDNFNHRINARAEIKIDSNNMLFIIPSISFQTNRSERSSLLKSYVENGDSLYNAVAGNVSDRSGYNIRNNMLYRRSLAKKGRIFTAGLNTTFTKNDGLSNINGTYRFYDPFGFPVLPDSVQQQNADNRSDGYTIGGNITYNEPLGKAAKSQLQFEYNPTYQKNKADQQTFSYDGVQYTKFDTLLSNRFDNVTVTQNAGLAFRRTPSKDEQFTLAVNVQETRLTSDRIFPVVASVDQRFRNILPSANWRKKLSRFSNFRSFYRASTQFPSINQLQDVVSFSNTTTVSVGNKELKQTYSHFMGGRYTYTNTQNNRSFFMGAFMQLSRNFISNATFVASADSVLQQGIVLRKGSQLSKPVNLDGYRFLRSFMTFSMPIKKIKTTVTVNAFFIYNRQPGLVNNIATVTNTYQYNAGLVLASNISEYVDYNVNYNAAINRAATRGTIVTRNDYVNHSLSATLNVLSKKGWFMQHELNTQVFTGLAAGFDQTYSLWNVSVGKKFLKNKSGELKFTLFDLLKQNQSISRTITNLYVEDAQSRVLQQYGMVTFSYNLRNFGNPKKTETKDDFIQPVGYPRQGM